MYTQEQEQLRLALQQFFGSILVSSNLKESSMKKQSLVALVTEELTKICKDENEKLDILAAKPLIKGTHHILTKRLMDVDKELEEIGLTYTDRNSATEELTCLIENLQNYINSIK